jgi:2-(1,2-epoxy-1,2-dihydrophenyl)acetyl-CoA isomerase
MVEPSILYNKNGNIGVVTLNRPEKLNALTPDMNNRIRDICDEIKHDDEVRGVILTGNGRAFCAGTDVSGQARDVPAGDRTVSRVRTRLSTFDHATLWGFTNIPKPTVCAINGAAVGLGAELTLHCDVRIASQSARWGQVFVLRGWVPDTGAGTYLLPRLVGLSKACELVFSGEIINGQEMLRIGLVSQLVPDSNLGLAALEMAKKLVKGAPLAVKMAKELIYRGLERNIEEHAQANSAAFGMLTATEDHLEGVKSFLEKREPRWKGR